MIHIYSFLQMRWLNWAQLSGLPTKLLSKSVSQHKFELEHSSITAFEAANCNLNGSVSHLAYEITEVWPWCSDSSLLNWDSNMEAYRLLRTLSTLEP